MQVKNFQSKQSLKLPDFSKFKLHLQKMPPFDLLIYLFYQSNIIQIYRNFIQILHSGTKVFNSLESYELNKLNPETQNIES